MSDSINPEITWTVPIQQANIILQVLGRQPHDEVAQLIAFLRRQADAQIQMLQQQQNVAQSNQVPMKAAPS